MNLAFQIGILPYQKAKGPSPSGIGPEWIVDDRRWRGQGQTRMAATNLSVFFYSGMFFTFFSNLTTL